MDLGNLPLLANDIILQHLGSSDWRSLREVSKAWLETVNLKITNLGRGACFQDLSVDTLVAKFPSLATLYVTDETTRHVGGKLEDWLLGLPNLQELYGLKDLEAFDRLHDLQTPEEIAQRASLASRLTTLSLKDFPDAPGEGPVWDFTELMAEWCHIRRLTLCPGPRINCLEGLNNLAGSLEVLHLVWGFPSETLDILDLLALWPSCKVRELCINIPLYGWESGTASEYQTMEDFQEDTNMMYTAVARLTQLEKLTVTGRSKDIAQLNSLEHLTSLSLPNSGSTSQELRQLTGLTALASLDFTNNLLTSPSAIRNGLRPFPHLRHLDISECRLVRADVAIGQLTGLTSLRARNCDDLGSLAPLSTLTQLEALDLAHTAFDSLRHITGFSRLTALDITRWRSYQRGEGDTTEEGLVHLGRLTSLRHLCLAHALDQSVWDPCSWPDNPGRADESSALFSHLSGLSSLAFLNVQPRRDEMPVSQRLGAWRGLESLQHLPLQEVCLQAPVVPPTSKEATQLFEEAERALEGASPRLRMAFLRGTRGWCTQAEAQALLMPWRERQACR